MKPTAMSQLQGLSKIEDLVDFVMEIKNVKAVVEEMKNAEKSSREAYKRLELGNKAKNLEAAIDTSEALLKKTLGKVEEVKQEYTDITQSAQTDADEIRTLINLERDEFEKDREDSLKRDTSTKNLLDAREASLNARDEALKKNEERLAQSQAKAEAIKREYQSRLERIENAAKA